MSDEYADLLEDLGNEAAALDAHLSRIEPAAWDLPTPAKGWSIKDCVSHLAHIDGLAIAALTEPDDFRAAVDGLGTPGRQTGPEFTANGVADRHHRTGADILDEWRVSHGGVLDVLRRTDPKDRVPWFARPMSARSFATARLMETWAHGLDTFDALGRRPVDTDRLRHVALLGCLTRGFSFAVHRADPGADVAVRLVLPSGTGFTYGPDAAGDRVLGAASDFCRVVTRRRHVEDTELEVIGHDAQRWMLLAQAYAGQPGPGRRPGQFSSVHAEER